jgi:hypothetical protein
MIFIRCDSCFLFGRCYAPQCPALFERRKDDEVSSSVKFIILSVVGIVDFCFRGQIGSPSIHQCEISMANGGEYFKNFYPLFACVFSH